MSRPRRRPAAADQARRRSLSILALVLLMTLWCGAAVGSAAVGRAAPAAPLAVPTATGIPCLHPAVEWDPASTSAQIRTTFVKSGRIIGTSGGEVHVRVGSGPREGDELTVTRDGALFSVQYTSDVAGTDRLVAELVVGGRVVATGASTHEWTREPPPLLTLRPDTSTGPVDEAHEVVLDWQNWDGETGDLTVSVVSGPHAGTVLGRDDAGGYSYLGTTAGTDTLQAVLVLGGETFTSNSVTRDWLPTIMLRPDGGELVVGDVQTFVVTVRGTDEAPVLGVTDGPNAGLDVPLAADGDYFGSYSSELPGTDTLQAQLPGSGVRSNAVRHTWIPRPQTVTLRPDGSTSTVDEQHVVDVVVTGTDESPVVEVVDGVNAGRTLDLRGGPGTFSAVYGSDVAGPDSIRATLPSGVTSNTVGHTWLAILDLTAPQQTLFVNQEVTVAVTAIGTTEKPTVRVVDGPNAGVSLDVFQGEGAWWAIYTSTTVGTDSLRAFVTYGQSQVVTVSWNSEPVVEVVPAEARPAGHAPRIADRAGRADLRRDAAPASVATTRARALPAAVAGEGCLQVVVAPADAASQVGTDVTFTATVTDDVDQPVDAAAVTLTGTLAGQPDEQVSATTGSNGVATFSRTRAAPGTETLTAVATKTDLGTGAGSTSHTWLPDQGIRASVAPAGAVSPVGSTFTATVTVRDDAGAPLEGAAVTYLAVMPVAGLPDVTRDKLTNGQGRVSFDYTRPVAGTETISVVARHEGREARASTSHVWQAVPGLGVRFEPAGTTTLAGSDFTPTVLVTLDGAPVKDADVVLTATMPGQPAIVSPAEKTGDSGLASFTYTRDVAGDEVVSAVATVAGRSGEAAIVHSWQLVPDLHIDIGPPGESSLIGADFTATVTVTDGESPIAGASVSLVRTLAGESADGGTPDPGAADVTDPDQRTDADGRASFTWSRSVPGLERVVARVAVDDTRSGETSMAHVWRNGRDVGADGPVLRVVGGGGLSGSTTEVTGTGCPFRSEVAIDLPPATADDQAVTLGTATADDQGDYRTTIVVPQLPVGRYEITGTCPPVTATGTLDVVVASSTTGTAGSAAATVTTVMTFFVLLGGQLLRMNTPVAGTGGGG